MRITENISGIKFQRGGGSLHRVFIFHTPVVQNPLPATKSKSAGKFTRVASLMKTDNEQRTTRLHASQPFQQIYNSQIQSVKRFAT